MDEELIEAVRNNPVLFDTNDPQYLKSKLKDEIWNKIAKNLNLKHGNEAKDMWLKLRNCHREALRRQKRYLRSAAAGTVTKKWRYQREMEFLIPYMSNRGREENLENYGKDEDLQEQSENADILDFENMSKTENYLLPAEIETDSQKSSLQKEPEKSIITTRALSGSIASTTTISKTKTSKKNEKFNLSEESIKQPQKRAKGIEHEREREKPVDDVLYHFFMSMYQITKQLPPTYQHIIRNNVFQVVSGAEADYLNIDNSQSQPSYLQQSYPQQLSSNAQASQPYQQQAQQWYRPSLACDASCSSGNAGADTAFTSLEAQQLITSCDLKYSNSENSRSNSPYSIVITPKSSPVDMKVQSDTDSA